MMIVFRKELQEMLRDKRVRSSAFFGPIFLIFLFLFVLGNVLGNIGKPENTRVHLVRTTSPLVEVLRKANFKIIDVPTEADAQKLIEDGKAKAVVSIQPPKDGLTEVKIFSDPKEQLGTITQGVVTGALKTLNDAALAQFLAKNKVPAADVAPIKITPVAVAVGTKGSASEFLVGLLPYLIVIWAFYGGMSTATDLVAGEKERNTLETLLITPQPRTGIILGKLLALGVICLMSSLSSLIGLALYSLLRLPGSEATLKNGLGLTLPGAALIILLLVPLVAFFSSLLIAVSTFAKNAREAQTYLSLASFVVIIPAMFSQFIGLTEFANASWINYIPVLNTSNNIRLTLMGKPDFGGSLVAIAICLGLAAIMVRYTVSLFQKETVLVRI